MWLHVHCRYFSSEIHGLHRGRVGPATRMFLMGDLLTPSLAATGQIRRYLAQVRGRVISAVLPVALTSSGCKLGESLLDVVGPAF
jgi:hypothetical protein